MRIAFVGAGLVGSALALALTAHGHEVAAVASRSCSSAERLARRLPGCEAVAPQEAAERADLVFLTTPDDAIGVVAAGIRWRAGQRVVHCSGALSAAVLEPAREAGCLAGSFHPLQTFATVEGAIASLPGTAFGIEAEGVLATELSVLATELGGWPVAIRAEDKVLYHAGAAIASNYLVALVGLAADLWAELGVGRGEAVEALLPLLRGTLGNLERVGLPRALTGPIARGDLGTVRRHLDALAERAPGVLPAYALLGGKAVELALEKGTLGESQAGALAGMLGGAAPDGTVADGEASHGKESGKI